MQILTQKLDNQHETEKLSARITGTLSAIQKKSTDYERETEALHQKLDQQQQCALVAK